MAVSTEQIGKYDVRRTMGEGAMGVVLEGFDPHIERRVAIKCLHPHLIQNDSSGQFLQRFKQEAQAAARCSHPNIVTILEYGEHNDAPYIVMEYIEGVNLQDLLAKKRIKHLKNVISFVGQILKALHTAHEQGVIHRDVKPANVLIMNNGTVKLADFGIARVPTDENLTQAGIAIGTPRYMSPEQAMAHPIDNRADLYALTMMFAQMLTELTLDRSITAECIPEIDGMAKSHYVNHSAPVPTAFIPIILKGLAFNPDNRIQTAKDYLTRLKLGVNALKRAAPVVRVPSEDEPTEINPSAVSNDAPENEQPPVAQPLVDPVELQSLQTILSGYIGPIARNIVESEAGLHTDPSDLVRAVSSEIEDQNERQAFIRDWEAKSGQSSAKKVTDTDSSPGQTVHAPVLTDAVRTELESNFAQFVGPLASRLVAMHESESRSFSGLIAALSEEIPDDDDRRAFEKQWENI
ncbi:MAG: serine/threonine-protein kinase [Pseudomonadota bacterium]